jgi:hypothetical protein
VKSARGLFDAKNKNFTINPSRSSSWRRPRARSPSRFHFAAFWVRTEPPRCCKAGAPLMSAVSESEHESFWRGREARARALSLAKMQRAAAHAAGAPPPRSRRVAGKAQAHAGAPRAYGGRGPAMMHGWSSETDLDAAPSPPSLLEAEGEQKKRRLHMGGYPHQRA